MQWISGVDWQTGEESMDLGRRNDGEIDIERIQVGSGGENSYLQLLLTINQ